ncbi:MAG: hypothetical protein MJA32_05670, partial [Proteobacteria bacterium]|nr:hypothetical protein [Pseudomonadota bacterium]
MSLNWIAFLGTASLLAPVFAHSGEAPATARIPAAFVANHGQFDDDVVYVTSIPPGRLFVERSGDLTYALSEPGDPAGGWAIRESFVNGEPVPVTSPETNTITVNYFVGAADRWRKNVPAYGRIGLGEVWSGIEVELLSQGHNVEKRFTVAPGAAVADIEMAFDGLSHSAPLSISEDGKLVARTPIGRIEFTAPVAWQVVEGERRPVAVSYRVDGARYGFVLGAFDFRLPVVIDPLIASSHMGASGASPRYVVHNGFDDEVFVAGHGASTDFPVTPGVIEENQQPAFIARFSDGLTALEVATFFGGSGTESIEALHYRADTNELLIAGWTSSDDLPGATGGAQSNPSNPGSGESDGFVASLNRSLNAINQASYLGGADCDAVLAGAEELVTDLAVHPASGDVYVTGKTCAVDFPGVAGGAYPVQPAPPGEAAFVSRLSADLATLRQSTYYGDSTGGIASNAIAVHPVSGDVYIGGYGASNLPGTEGGFQPAPSGAGGEIFVARFAAGLTRLSNATYYYGTTAAGPRGFAGLQLADLIVGASGDVFVTGLAHTSDPPGLAGGAQTAYGGGDTDAYVARLNAGLTGVVAATLFGGEEYEYPAAMAQHPTTTAIFVVGETNSTMLPGVAGALETFGGRADGFAVEFDRSLSVLNQATYLGGSGSDAALDVAAGQTIYVAGTTNSTDFPGVAGGEFQDGAGFVTLFDTLGDGVAPVADLNVFVSDDPDPVEEGSLVTLTVTAQNTGPDDATGVVVTYPLPTGVAFDSADTICALSNISVNCDVGSLAGPTSSVEFDINVVMPSGFAGTIEHEVSIAGNENDPDDQDNSFTAQTAVTPSGLRITDSIGAVDDLSLPFGEIRVGEGSVATVTVLNQSGVTSVDISMTEFLQSPFSFDDAAACDVTLAPGASCVLTVRYRPTAAAAINEN